MSRRRSFEVRERRRSAWTAELAERHAALVRATVRLPARELAEVVSHLAPEVRAEVLAGRATFQRGMQRFQLANRARPLPSRAK